VQEMLNRDAGLRGLGGANDMRELRARAGAGAAGALLAVAVFCRSVVKMIAGYVALYGADALVFTGGIGEHDPVSRTEIVRGLSAFGILLDEAANAAPRSERLNKVSRPESRIAVYVAEAEEDLIIARHVAGMCCESQNLDEIEA
jgi:acetate kinase